MIILLLALLFLVENRVSAMLTGFSTTEMDEQTKQRIVTSLELSLLDKEPKKKPVCCFDVNEKEQIAIGWATGTSNKKIIGVYLPDGTFLYGYQFYISGDFGVEWDKETLIIYIVRGDTAISINANGTIDEIRKIENTIENNSYWIHSVKARQREVGTNLFIRKSNMGPFNLIASSSSQIIKIDVSGKKTLVYDVNRAYLIRIAAKTILVALFVVLVITRIVLSIKKKS